MTVTYLYYRLKRPSANSTMRGQTKNQVNFLLTERDHKAVLRFLRKAMSRHAVPEKITIDKSGLKYNKFEK